MRQRILLDTGPLVALLDKSDRWHQWTKEQWLRIEPPLLTCEPVITESCFLLRRIHGGRDAVFALLAKQVIQVRFELDNEKDAVRRLLSRYESVPMSLADGCLVRMAEQYPGSRTLTFDSDFGIYRKNRNQIIDVLSPFKT